MKALGGNSLFKGSMEAVCQSPMLKSALRMQHGMSKQYVCGFVQDPGQAVVCNIEDVDHNQKKGAGM